MVLRKSVPLCLLLGTKDPKITMNSFLQGTLFIYYPERRLTAFISGKRTKYFLLQYVFTLFLVSHIFRRHAVFIGGLTDAFLATPYLITLQKELENCGWDLVQIFLTSSHVGFGLTSLAQYVLIGLK
jgi:hypothetical protein